MKKLELIEKAKSLFPNISLEKTCIIGAQHILPTTLTMFQSLFEKGLKADNLFLIGKCYSTNPSTYQKMLQNDIYVCPSSLKFNCHEPYDDQYDRHISDFLKHVLDTIDIDSYEKIIIMDDGGQLIRALHAQVSDFHKFVALEQTTAGYQNLKNYSLRIPVVNVARSTAKLQYETPIVTRSIKNKFFQFLKNNKINPSKILIIGNGIIGKAMKKELEDLCEIRSFDTQKKISDFAFENLHAHLSEFDIIIGCTGTTSIRQDQLKFLKKNSYLISASSSDREFCSAYIRKKAETDISCHSTVENNGICLVNCGFPINFDNDFDTVDNEDYQLTRSLLTIAIFQAYLLRPIPGIINLDLEAQDSIIASHLNRLEALISL